MHGATAIFPKAFRALENPCHLILIVAIRLHGVTMLVVPAA